MRAQVIRRLRAGAGPAADPGARGPGVTAPIRDGLPQPNAFTCGAAALVVARRLLGPPSRPPAPGPWAAGPDGFARDVRAAHREVTWLRGQDGGLHPPWPRFLGTPPWGMAAALSSVETVRAAGVRYRVRSLSPRRRAQAYDAVLDALAGGRPVPLYIGSRTLPRHVVLAVDGTPARLRVYEPSRGGTMLLTREHLVAGSVRVGRWHQPWFAVLPEPAG